MGKQIHENIHDDSVYRLVGKSMVKRKSFKLNAEHLDGFHWKVEIEN